MDMLKAEQRDNVRAGRLFAEACAVGDVDQLLRAADMMSLTTDGWRLAMLKAGRLASVSDEIKQAFLHIWIESKALPLDVGHRRTMANALHVLLPEAGTTKPMRLYRGTRQPERNRRLYGFSWTTDKTIARDKFAAHWQDVLGDGIVLETLAPPEAIMHVRRPQDYYDEGEVIVDPFLLDKVTVNEALRRP